MKIFVTGSNGFIGRNIIEQLSAYYNIIAPSRKELDLLNTDRVGEYLKKNRFDVVIHTANTNEFHHNEIDKYMLLNYNLRMYFNLELYNQYYGKMIYFGSGAEYDMEHYKPYMQEEYFETYIPKDSYGFSKYIMAKSALDSTNIYDLVLFGVFGRYEEWKRRFISNNIYNNMMGKTMTLNQNMFFDYIYIDDLIKILRYFIEYTPAYKRYNICRGEKIDLLTLANIINKVMNTNVEIKVFKNGFKSEYTGNNTRIQKEINSIEFEPYELSILKLVEFYQKNGFV